MTLTSPTFNDGAFMPAKHHYRQGNRAPGFWFKEVPKETKSLALLCDDPDAPSGSWSHWVVYDMPPASIGIKEGMPPNAVIPDVAHQGMNDYGSTGWGGPCPPSGTHHYVFRLFALDIALGPRPGLKKAGLLEVIEGHVIEEARLTGLFAAESQGSVGDSRLPPGLSPTSTRADTENW
jgi:Raf kinase inhibitor-like YbhB/YbcL family protein